MILLTRTCVERSHFREDHTLVIYCLSVFAVHNSIRTLNKKSWHKKLRILSLTRALSATSAPSIGKYYTTVLDVALMVELLYCCCCVMLMVVLEYRFFLAHPTYCIFALFLSRSPSLDVTHYPGSHGGLFFPLPIPPLWCMPLFLSREDFSPFSGASSIRIESRLPTLLGALSS